MAAWVPGSYFFSVVTDVNGLPVHGTDTMASVDLDQVVHGISTQDSLNSFLMDQYQRGIFSVRVFWDNMEHDAPLDDNESRRDTRVIDFLLPEEHASNTQQLHRALKAVQRFLDRNPGVGTLCVRGSPATRISPFVVGHMLASDFTTRRLEMLHSNAVPVPWSNRVWCASARHMALVTPELAEAVATVTSVPISRKSAVLLDPGGRSSVPMQLCASGRVLVICPTAREPLWTSLQTITTYSFDGLEFDAEHDDVRLGNDHPHVPDDACFVANAFDFCSIVRRRRYLERVRCPYRFADDVDDSDSDMEHDHMGSCVFGSSVFSPWTTHFDRVVVDSPDLIDFEVQRYPQVYRRHLDHVFTVAMYYVDTSLPGEHIGRRSLLTNLVPSATLMTNAVAANRLWRERVFSVVPDYMFEPDYDVEQHVVVPTNDEHEWYVSACLDDDPFACNLLKHHVPSTRVEFCNTTTVEHVLDSVVARVVDRAERESCPICYAAESNVRFSCGHRCCDRCALTMWSFNSGRPSCHLCRSSIDDMMHYTSWAKAMSSFFGSMVTYIRSLVGDLLHRCGTVLIVSEDRELNRALALALENLPICTQVINFWSRTPTRFRYRRKRRFMHSVESGVVGLCSAKDLKGFSLTDIPIVWTGLAHIDLSRAAACTTSKIEMHTVCLSTAPRTTIVV